MKTIWPSVRIDSVGQVQAGRQRSVNIVSGSLRPYLRVANVFDGFIDFSDVLEMPFTEREFSTYQLCRGDILLNEGQSLDLVGRSAMFTGEEGRYCFQNTLVRFRPSDVILPEFAQNVFQHYLYTGVFATIASRTTSIAHLGVERFASLHIPLPNIQEQRKITEILSFWDRGIRQLSDLIAAKVRFKQGLMQQLLTGKRRFPEFVQSNDLRHTACGIIPDDWKQSPLNRIVQEVKRKNNEGVTRVLTASGNRGLVDQREYFNRKVAGDSLDKYYLLKHGEFAYNRSLMNGYPYGATKRLEDYDSGVLSTLYLCFQITSSECNSDFLALLFDCGLLNSQLRGIARMGARAHGLLNVTADEFFDMVIPLPGIEEQRRIATFLNTMSREIELLRKELETIKTQKKGLMQKLLTGQIRVPFEKERLSDVRSS